MALGFWVQLLLVLTVVSGIVGAIASWYQDSVTREHLPALLLIVLGITAGVTVALEMQSLQQDVDQVEYIVNPCEPGEDTTITPVTPGDDIREFDSLSPGAQEIFESALETDGGYTTTKRPEDLVYRGDTNAMNFVRYNDTCYSLVGDSGGGLGTAFGMQFLIFIGLPISLVLLVAGLFSLYRN